VWGVAGGGCSDNLGLQHVSAGDVLREAAAAGTPMGLRAKECMDRGELVPTDVAVTLVKERLQQDDCRTGWILDGCVLPTTPQESIAESHAHGATASVSTPSWPSGATAP